MTKQIETGKAIDKGNTEKVTVPKKVNGRLALDSANKKRAITALNKTSQSIGMAVTDSMAELAKLNLVTDKATGVKHGREVNDLGHMISASTGSIKNTIVDYLLCNAGKQQAVSIDWVASVLTDTRISNGKVFTRKALLNKWRAHGRHFAGNGKVTFAPIKPVDNKLLIAVHNELNDTVCLILKG